MPSWKSGKERRSPRSETKRRSPRERGEVRWRNIQRTTRVRSTSRSSGSREGAEDSGGMPPTTRTYVGYLRRRAESPPKHRHQSSRIKMLDSKRDDVAPRPVGMGRGAHRRMIPPHSHTHTLHTKGRRHASGGRAQAKVHGLNLSGGLTSRVLGPLGGHRGRAAPAWSVRDLSSVVSHTLSRSGTTRYRKGRSKAQGQAPKAARRPDSYADLRGACEILAEPEVNLRPFG